MERICIEKGKILGRVKPMHCVNNFPQLGTGLDATFAALKVPYSRLHDTTSLNPHLVDVHAVFPDFDRDPSDPEAYDFAFTDWCLRRLHDAGIQPFYRLGASIENYHAIKPYHIFPPKDAKKWARICEYIVAHYNEGWNKGFRWGIQYWEIWNEPDNDPDPANNAMWKGRFSEYLRLYEITANHLKKRFPEIKVGGYASCGFYSILRQDAAAQANVSSRTDYFLTCAEEFLRYISSEEHRAPLDFFSWHSYSDVYANVAYARYARELLDRYGFLQTESNLNEWNPGIQYRGTLRDASNICANMLALQNEPLDMLMYYDCRVISVYCGLFDPVGQKPFPAYYVFAAFSELYRLGQTTALSGASRGLFACSATDGTRGLLLLTNASDAEKEIECCGADFVSFKKLTEGDGGFVPVQVCGNRLTLQPYDVALAEYRA